MVLPLTHMAVPYVLARLRRWPWPTWAILLGGLLPDLIDKPVGLLMGLGNGRLVVHTPLFLVVLAAWAATRSEGRIRIAGIAVAFGVATHLLLDGVFLDTHLLLWPLDGAGFPSGDYDLERYWGALFRPAAWVGGLEILSVVGIVAWWVWRRRRSMGSV